MKKEIYVKKFGIGLGIFLVVLTIVLYFIFTKTRPLCIDKNNPCRRAICESCTYQDGKKKCKSCNVYNDKKQTVWTGGCVFSE